MYQPKQVLVKKVYNDQVWYESCPISEASTSLSQTSRRLNEPNQPSKSSLEDFPRYLDTREQK